MVMKHPDCAILERLSDADFKAVRFQIIQLVLATDLACTFEYTCKFQSLLNQGSDFEKPSDILLLMQIMIKCADVSHATRILPLHKKWTSRIVQEFHNQGDRERKEKMAISPLVRCTAYSLTLWMMVVAGCGEGG
jgi:3',5'-cyclic-nucleotide phosphodiesterase/cAMP-specific phosphodiesterase 4